MIGLRPILSDSAPNTMKKPRAEQQRPGDQQVGGVAVDLRGSIAGRTARRTGRCTRPRPGPWRQPISARMHDLGVAPVGRRLPVSGAFELLPSSFIFWNTGDSFSRSRIHTEMPSSRTDTRNGMRQPQAANSGFAERRAREQDHQQRQEQAERRRGLDERGVVAALALRRMLGDIGRRAAVLAAERTGPAAGAGAIRMIGAADADGARRWAAGRR